MHCSFLLLLATTATSADPPPKAGPAGLYYPTAVGAKLVYEARAGDSASESSETVEAVTEKDGVFRVTARLEGGGKSARIEYDVSARGLDRHVRAGKAETRTIPLLKLPLKGGDTWSWEMKGPDGQVAVKTTYTVGKAEEVEVPAGKFRAVRVESRREGKATTKATLWYAPDVGLVKMVTALPEGDRTQVLKSFTRGK